MEYQSICKRNNTVRVTRIKRPVPYVSSFFCAWLHSNNRLLTSCTHVLLIDRLTCVLVAVSVLERSSCGCKNCSSFQTQLLSSLQSSTSSCNSARFHWTSSLEILIFWTDKRTLKYSMCVQLNPDNSNHQGKHTKVRVIGSLSYRELRTNDWK